MEDHQTCHFFIYYACNAMNHVFVRNRESYSLDPWVWNIRWIVTHTCTCPCYTIIVNHFFNLWYEDIGPPHSWSLTNIVLHLHTFDFKTFVNAIWKCSWSDLSTLFLNNCLIWSRLYIHIFNIFPYSMSTHHNFKKTLNTRRVFNIHDFICPSVFFLE